MHVLFLILLFFHVLVCVLLVLIILMQRPKQEGLGAAFASGMMHDSFGAQTTDVLQKATRTLAITFFVLSICLAVMKAQESQALRKATRHKADATATVPLPAEKEKAAPQPAAPGAPAPAEKSKTEPGKPEAKTPAEKPAPAPAP